MPKVMILCAMRSEAAALPAQYPSRIVGIGFRAAKRSTEAAISEIKPDRIVSAGTCGALDPAITLGEVFTVSKIQSSLGEFHPVVLDANTTELFSQDAVAITVSEKHALRTQGASIVDMEAAAIAEVCARHGVPFACLKAVSDLATENLPINFNQYRDVNGGFQNARIAFAGIMKIKALMRLQRQSKLAVRRLGEALAPALKIYS